MVRKIKAKLVLRLRADSFSSRQIEARGMSRHSVIAVLEAADREGISWDDVAELDDTVVCARLFPGRGEHESVHAQPDWEQVHRELARVGVTLKLLHGEYVDACQADGSTAMGYDRFCKTYQQHALVAGAASRVGHKAAQTVEVDWSGKTMALTDPVTGQQARVYLFVAALPFSRFAFVEPALDMRQDTWLRAHVAMFDWLGGSVGSCRTTSRQGCSSTLRRVRWCSTTRIGSWRRTTAPRCYPGGSRSRRTRRVLRTPSGTSRPG